MVIFIFFLNRFKICFNFISTAFKIENLLGNEDNKAAKNSSSPNKKRNQAEVNSNNNNEYNNLPSSLNPALIQQQFYQQLQNLQNNPNFYQFNFQPQAQAQQNRFFS